MGVYNWIVLTQLHTILVLHGRFHLFDSNGSQHCLQNWTVYLKSYIYYTNQHYLHLSFRRKKKSKSLQS